MFLSERLDVQANYYIFMTYRSNQCCTEVKLCFVRRQKSGSQPSQEDTCKGLSGFCKLAPGDSEEGWKKGLWSDEPEIDLFAFTRLAVFRGKEKLTCTP